jgi:hypothetical protein
MPHALCAALFVCLALAAPASAITYVFSGTVTTLSDGTDLLDASVDLGTPVSGSYEVDPSSGSGGSPFAVGLAQLAFALGNYSFAANENPHELSLIDDRVVSPSPLITVDIWQSRGIVMSDLSPATNPGGGFAGYAAQLEFFDFSSSQFDGSETAPIVPSGLAGWDQVRLSLNSLMDDGGGSTSIDGRVQVQIDLDSWGAAPVPEPSSGSLVTLGVGCLVLRARRRATRR